MKQILVFCLLLVLLRTTNAQPVGVQPPYDQVTISLTKSSIRTAVYPFDVPFLFTGKVPANCRRIRFYYNVSAHEMHGGRYRSWISLPTSTDVGVSFLSDDVPVTSTDDAFFIKCRGVHPNMKYDLRFEVFKDFAGDDNLKKQIKQKLSAEIVDFTSRFLDRGFHDSDLNELNRKLTKILENSVRTNNNTEIRSKKNIDSSIVIDVHRQLNSNFGNLQRQNHLSMIAKDALYGVGNEVRDLMNEFRAAKANLLRDIESVIKGTAGLNEASSQSLDMLLTPSLVDFQGYTVRNGLLALKRLCQNDVLMDSLLHGGLKIYNNDIAAATGPNGSSIFFLNALIQYLHQGNISTAGRVALFGGIDGLADQMGVVAKDEQQLLDAKAKLAAELDKMPDLTLDIVTLETVTADIISVPDVMTQNTPYISVDGGLGYSSAFQSVYSYYGANFYLSPVNKKAPLHTFRKWNLVKKMLSFNIGIANLFGDRVPHTYSLLGTNSKADLLVGLGIRTGRVVKVNFACFPYTVGDNPVTDGRKLKLSFAAGVGIDVNLLGALGTVAKALSLTQ